MSILITDIAELSEYAWLEGSEIGSYLISLLELYECHPESHGRSPAVTNALETEMKFWLQKFKAETTIVKKVEPQPDKVYKELEWHDE